MEEYLSGFTRKITVNNVDFFCDGPGRQHFKAFGHCFDIAPQYDVSRPIEYWKAQLIFRGFSPKGHSIDALKARFQAANTNTMDQKVAAAYQEENTTGRKRKRRDNGGVDPTAIAFPFESSYSVKQEPRNQQIWAADQQYQDLDPDYDDIGVTQEESVRTSMSPRSKKARADQENHHARCETEPESPIRSHHERHSPPDHQGPSEPRYDELTDISKGEKVSELARIMWAERRAVRTIEHRNPSKLLNLASKANYESAVAYMRGDIAPNPCETCDPASGRSRGPFRQCVVYPGKFSGACCNCRYNKKGDSCSSHELNVNPEARAARAKNKGKGPASPELNQIPAVETVRRSATAAAMDPARSRSKSRDNRTSHYRNGESGDKRNLANGVNDTEHVTDEPNLPHHNDYDREENRPRSRSTSSSIPVIRLASRRSEELSEDGFVISYPLTQEYEEQMDVDQTQPEASGVEDEVVRSQEGIRDLDLSDEPCDITGKWEIQCPKMAFSFGQDTPYLLSIYTSDRRLGRETYGRFDLDQVSGVFRFSAGTYGDDDYENETDEFLLDPGDAPSTSDPTRSYRWRGTRSSDGAVQTHEDKKLYSMTFSKSGNEVEGTWGTWQGAFGRLQFSGTKISSHSREESMHIQQAWKDLDG